MKQVRISKRATEDWLDEEENIYSDEYREHLLEDDEISMEEESWVEGYEQARNEEVFDELDEDFD